MSWPTEKELEAAKSWRRFTLPCSELDGELRRGGIPADSRSPEGLYEFIWVGDLPDVLRLAKRAAQNPK